MKKAIITPSGQEIVDIAGEELTQYQNEINEPSNSPHNLKLEELRKIRTQKLQETDYLANSDMTMPDNIKTWRQSLRDIPQTYTTEEEYDLLLTQDEQGNLTHEIWSKP